MDSSDVEALKVLYWQFQNVKQAPKEKRAVLIRSVLAKNEKILEWIVFKKRPEDIIKAARLDGDFDKKLQADVAFHIFLEKGMGENPYYLGTREWIKRGRNAFQEIESIYTADPSDPLVQKIFSNPTLEKKRGEALEQKAALETKLSEKRKAFIERLFHIKEKLSPLFSKGEFALNLSLYIFKRLTPEKREDLLSLIGDKPYEHLAEQVSVWLDAPVPEEALVPQPDERKKATGPEITETDEANLKKLTTQLEALGELPEKAQRNRLIEILSNSDFLYEWIIYEKSPADIAKASQKNKELADRIELSNQARHFLHLVLEKKFLFDDIEKVIGESHFWLHVADQYTSDFSKDPLFESLKTNKYIEQVLSKVISGRKTGEKHLGDLWEEGKPSEQNQQRAIASKDVTAYFLFHLPSVLRKKLFESVPQKAYSEATRVLHLAATAPRYEALPKPDLSSQTEGPDLSRVTEEDGAAFRELYEKLKGTIDQSALVRAGVIQDELINNDKILEWIIYKKDIDQIIKLSEVDDAAIARNILENLIVENPVLAEIRKQYYKHDFLIEEAKVLIEESTKAIPDNPWLARVLGNEEAKSLFSKAASLKRLAEVKTKSFFEKLKDKFKRADEYMEPVFESGDLGVRATAYGLRKVSREKRKIAFESVGSAPYTVLSGSVEKCFKEPPEVKGVVRSKRRSLEIHETLEKEDGIAVRKLLRDIIASGDLPEEKRNQRLVEILANNDKVLEWILLRRDPKELLAAARIEGSLFENVNMDSIAENILHTVLETNPVLKAARDHFILTREAIDSVRSVVESHINDPWLLRIFESPDVKFAKDGTLNFWQKVGKFLDLDPQSSETVLKSKSFGIDLAVYLLAGMDPQARTHLFKKLGYASFEELFRLTDNAIQKLDLSKVEVIQKLAAEGKAAASESTDLTKIRESRLLGSFLSTYFGNISHEQKRKVVQDYLDLPLDASRSAEIKILVGHTGPLFRKIAQVYRKNLQSEEAKEALRPLLQGLPAFKGGADRIRAAYGDMIISLEEPEFAGSLAQVHRGLIRGPDGKPVETVIKILRPNLKTDLTREKAILDNVSDDPTWKIFLEGTYETILDELDLREEAKNIELGKKYLSYGIQVAQVVDGVEAKEDMIPLTVASGSSLDSLQERISPEVRGKLLKRVFNAWTSEVLFGDGVFHGDPHPGNIFVKLDPSGDPEKAVITLIDFGNAYVASRSERRRIVRMMIAANFDDKASLVRAVFEGIPHSKDRQKAVWDAVREIDFSNLTVGQKIERVLNLATDIENKGYESGIISDPYKVSNALVGFNRVLDIMIKEFEEINETSSEKFSVDQVIELILSKQFMRKSRSVIPGFARDEDIITRETYGIAIKGKGSEIGKKTWKILNTDLRELLWCTESGVDAGLEKSKIGTKK
ncbi:MAG: AarF/UbiB family protein [Bacteriovoracia bacterium]